MPNKVNVNKTYIHVSAASGRPLASRLFAQTEPASWYPKHPLEGTVAALGVCPYYWVPCTDTDFNHSVD